MRASSVVVQRVRVGAGRVGVGQGPGTSVAVWAWGVYVVTFGPIATWSSAAGSEGEGVLSLLHVPDGSPLAYPTLP